MPSTRHRRAIRRFIPFLATTGLVFWTACGGGDSGSPTGPSGPGTPSTPAVSSLTLSLDSLFFGGIGLTRSVAATAKAADGSTVGGASVAWTSSNTGVASVSSTGAVTAAGVGTTQITASSGSASASVKIVVQQVLAGLTVTPAQIALDSLGAVAEAHAAPADSGGTAMPGEVDVTWSVADGGVAVLVSRGRIQARGAGSTSLVATELGGTLTGSAAVRVDIPSLAGLVGGQGGKVEGQGGKVVLDVPAGAVDHTVAISTQPAAPSNADKVVSGTAVTIGPAITFSAPVDLTIAYEPASVPAGQEQASLGIYRQSGTVWIETGKAAVDSTTHTVVGTIDETGTYAVRTGRMGDPTGMWSASETKTHDTCYDEAGTTDHVSVWAELNGDVLTVEADGDRVSGKLVGNVFSWSDKYVEDGVNVTETHSVTISRDGSSATGTGHVVGTGPVNCEIRTTVEAKRISKQKPGTAAATVVDSVTLHFVEEPNASHRTWRPDIGDGTRIIAEVYKGGVKVPDVDVTVFAGTPLVLAQDQNPIDLKSGVATNLKPGLVGTTTLTANAWTEDGRVSESRPLTVDLVRDTTALNIISPAKTTGRFINLSPFIIWSDPNPEAVRWYLVAGSKRIFMQPERPQEGSTACTAGDRCLAVAWGMWNGLPEKSPGTAFIRVEGVNQLDQVVSKNQFDFTEAVTNHVLLSSNGVPAWEIWGHGDPGGASYASFTGDDSPIPCEDRDIERCAHAYSNGHEDGVWLWVERRPREGDVSQVQMYLPNAALEGGSAPWFCRPDYHKYPGETLARLSFDWYTNGAHAAAWSLVGTHVDDPLEADCQGTVTANHHDYEDIRGRWRVYEISGSGTMLSTQGLVTPFEFSVTAAVQRAPGEVLPPTYWSREAGVVR